MNQLAVLIERLSERPGLHRTSIPGLTVFRTDVGGDALEAIDRKGTDEPALCVVVQGRKNARIGSRHVVYEPGAFSITSIDLPVTNTIIEATPAMPFLGLQLRLQPALLSELLLDFDAEPLDTAPRPSVSVSELGADLDDSLVRLVRALRDRQDAAVLGPMAVREISYRLLRGPQRALLAQIANAGSRLSQIKQSIEWIRANYTEPLRIETVAAIASMSSSSFHQHFKAVTAMTPLQYQKHLRLLEARRLLLAGEADATTAAHQVGYGSASQFSREYKRLFGAPPVRDLGRLRQAS